MTSGATAESTGVESQRFLLAQFAVHRGTFGKGLGDIHEGPPL